MLTLKYTLQFFSWFNILLFSTSFSPDIKTGHGQQDFFNYYLQSPFNVPMNTKDKERYVFHLSHRTNFVSCGAENMKCYFPHGSA